MVALLLCEFEPESLGTDAVISSLLKSLVISVVMDRANIETI